jgi:hypothetical protein
MIDLKAACHVQNGAMFEAAQVPTPTSGYVDPTTHLHGLLYKWIRKKSLAMFAKVHADVGLHINARDALTVRRRARHVNSGVRASLVDRLA